MRKFLVSIVLVAFISITVGCTEQSRAKNWGGSYTVDLPEGRKLVEVTWKNDEMWILTRNRRETETAENYTFQEDSSFGVMEGVVTLKEH
jgi:hypothetical protein